MRIEIHHVSILSENVLESIAFYCGHLGMRLAARFYQEGVMDMAVLRDGPGSTSFALHLTGPPFTDWMQEIYQQHGPSMDHLDFLVEDLDAWYRKLQAAGVDILSSPREFLHFRQMYCRDHAGMVVELQERSSYSVLPSAPSGTSGTGGIDYHMNHVSILCNDLAQLERFYSEHLDLETVFDRREEGFILMADPVFLADKEREAVTLEIMGPEAEWEREQNFLKEHGPGVDHLCFVVDDVDAAYRVLQDAGVNFNYPPEDMDGNRVAFFKDPNDVDVELMLSIPRSYLAA